MYLALRKCKNDRKKLFLSKNPEISRFSIGFRLNKLSSVFHASVLLLIMNNIVKTAVKPSGSVDYFDNVMTKFIVNNSTDALKTDINLFFTIANCQIVRSRSLTHHINYKFTKYAKHGPGSMDHPLDLVHGPPYGPPLILKRKSPLLI